jgi:putative ABC transport system permease protein
VWHAAIRDLIWRRRRYAISVAGTALVFAVSLVVTGISDAFPAELDHTFDALGATAFVVPVGTSGPMTGSQPFDPADLPAGVDPMAYLIQTANPDSPEMVAAMGLEPGRAEPRVISGTQLGGADDALVGDDSPFPTGSDLEIAGHTFRVVGRIADFSVNAGMPGVVIALESFQTYVLRGLAAVTTGIVRDDAVVAGPGYRVVDLPAAREDALRILGDAASTIDLVKVLLWVVAALIVGSVMFLTAVERSRDFAVFKAVGAGTRPLAGGIALQAAIISVTAGILGDVVGLLLAPMFAMPVVISARALVLLPVVALVVGLLSGAVALRRALAVDPAMAFGGAT